MLIMGSEYCKIYSRWNRQMLYCHLEEQMIFKTFKYAYPAIIILYVSLVALSSFEGWGNVKWKKCPLDIYPNSVLFSGLMSVEYHTDLACHYCSAQLQYISKLRSAWQWRLLWSWSIHSCYCSLYFVWTPQNLTDKRPK